MFSLVDFTNHCVELVPCDGRKSFYGKAKMFKDEKGNKWLLSYDTPIAVFTSDRKMHRLWGGWSATSGRHFNSFSDTVGCGLGGKQYWDSLPVEKAKDFK